MENTNVFDSKLEGFEKPVMTPEQIQASTFEEPEFKKSKKSKKFNESKELTYGERLKLIEVTKDSAIKIINSLVDNDKYTEEKKLSEKTKVVFSTRSVKFSDYLTRKLDSLEAKQMAMFNQVSTKYQLAASLEKYGDQAMPPLDNNLVEESWEKVLEVRLKFVSELPTPIFLALINHLSKFDMKMNVILSDGYEENF